MNRIGFRFFLLLITISLLLISCGDGTSGKHKAYVYKQPEPDGLLCVFYSSYAGNAEENAQMFADMHKAKYGVPLIVRTEPY